MQKPRNSDASFVKPHHDLHSP
jgi:hypothetical protein